MTWLDNANLSIAYAVSCCFATVSLASRNPLKYVSCVDFLLTCFTKGLQGISWPNASPTAALPRSNQPTRAYTTSTARCRGLALRIYPTGRKVFVFDWRENGRQRRTTIGQFPAWTIGKARTHASRMRLKADTGETVTPGRGGRVADLIEQWKDVVRLTRRPSTAKSYCRLIDSHIVPHFGKGEPRAITRNAVEQWHGQIAQADTARSQPRAGDLVAHSCRGWNTTTRSTAIRARACAVGLKISATSSSMPTRSRPPTPHSTRTTPATPRWRCGWRLLTGCRIGEVLLLEPAQIDAKRRIWIKPAAHTKQKKLHIVPLQAEALAIAKELLQHRAAGLRRLPPRLGSRQGRSSAAPDVRIHDLQASAAPVRWPVAAPA